MSSLQECEKPLKCVGYLNKCEPWKLHSRFFPSKVGGKVAWLNFSCLPSDINCLSCGKVCVLLCQVYAPVDNISECFHRTIFVFMCRNATCCKPNSNKNFRVFRCQLLRDNPYYPFEPPVEDKSWRPDVTVDKFCRVCILCGGKAPWHCGKCNAVYYCTKEHQTLHWKAGHKEKCSPGGGDCAKDEDVISQLLLPEFELLTEEEDEDDDDDDEGGAEEERRLREYQHLLRQGCAGTFQGDSTVDRDLEQMAACKEDSMFAAYVARMKAHPGQVLSYQRGGVPLCVSDHHASEQLHVPPCQLCGAPRIFEFQIFSVLLNHLNVDSVQQESIDWGTLLVYTCSNTCSNGPAYKEELLLKQDFASESQL